MPEGHTIHQLARDHQSCFAGRPVGMLSPQGRFADQAGGSEGRVLISVEALGKHLFYRFDDKLTGHVHLGLFGKFRVQKNPAANPRGAGRVRLIGNERTFALNGPNQCELLDCQQSHVLSGRLGQDPLRRDADVKAARERIGRSKRAVGSGLLDQSVIAGTGNIYRSELLFLQRIHPERRGADMSRDASLPPWEWAVRLLGAGVRYHRIITVTREEEGRLSSRLPTSERLHIYKKSHRSCCGGPVDQWSLAARTAYACQACQQ